MLSVVVLRTVAIAVTVAVMTAEVEDDLTAGRLRVRVEVSAGEETAAISPADRVAVILAGVFVAQFAGAVCRGLALCAPEEGDHVTAGAFAAGVEGGGRIAVGDAVFVSPEDRLIESAALLYVSEGVDGGLGLGAARRAPEEGCDLTAGAGGGRTEAGLADALGDVVLQRPDDRVIVSVALADIGEGILGLLCVSGEVSEGKVDVHALADVKDLDIGVTGSTGDFSAFTGSADVPPLTLAADLGALILAVDQRETAVATGEQIAFQLAAELHLGTGEGELIDGDELFSVCDFIPVVEVRVEYLHILGGENPREGDGETGVIGTLGKDNVAACGGSGNDYQTE